MACVINGPLIIPCPEETTVREASPVKIPTVWYAMPQDIGLLPWETKAVQIRVALNEDDILGGSTYRRRSGFGCTVPQGSKLVATCTVDRSDPNLVTLQLWNPTSGALSISRDTFILFEIPAVVL